MEILMIGLNYKTAPVEVREKLSFQGPNNELEKAMVLLKDQNSVLENVIISTCNRTEIYVVVDQRRRGRHYINQFLADWFDLRLEEFVPYLHICEGEEAVRHLFGVTCGLHSMVIGETQILGQVRSSFLLGQKWKATSTIFNMLFKEAITLGKRAHSETEIAENPLSVSYAAVQLAKNYFGTLKDCRVLIVGAGKMGELACQHVDGSGAMEIVVVNRTYEKAQLLGMKYNGIAKPIEELTSALIQADVVISSTGATSYVVTKEMIEDAIRIRGNRPLFMVDIAVPRDIEPSIQEIHGIQLCDIDNLEGIVEANMEQRMKAAIQIEGMIESEIKVFYQWLSTLEVIPVITALREKAFGIQIDTLQSLERKLPSLTERERKIINKLTRSIVNQILRDPILKVKEMANEPMKKENLQLFKEIFKIEEQVEQEMAAEKDRENATL